MLKKKVELWQQPTETKRPTALPWNLPVGSLQCSVLADIQSEMCSFNYMLNIEVTVLSCTGLHHTELFLICCPLPSCKCSGFACYRTRTAKARYKSKVTPPDERWKGLRLHCEPQWSTASWLQYLQKPDNTPTLHHVKISYKCIGCVNKVTKMLMLATLAILPYQLVASHYWNHYAE